MKFFLDTEFNEDGEIIDPISLALVAETDKTYYVEFPFDEEKAKRNNFLVEHVLPHLQYSRETRALMTPQRAALRILHFVQRECSYDESKPEFWAYYADYDWVLFCRLFGRMVDLPKSFPKLCLDLQQHWIMLGKPDVRPPKPENDHHALADAWWNKAFYEAMEGIP